MKKTDLVEAAHELSKLVGKLKFGAPITHVYNPLEYAWKAQESYLQKFGAGRKRVVFLGMNPGPFGMAQTGVPFGEVAVVRDWMKICTEVGKPAKEHPKRLITGFACERSEVSGRRLWGLFAKRFGAAEDFFAEHFVVNYCPLVFCEESGKNFTPDKLPAAEQAKLFAACDEHLRRVVEILEPEWLVGVGGFAQKRAVAVAEKINAAAAGKLHSYNKKVYARPHPGPLPRGEGETSPVVEEFEAVAEKIEAMIDSKPQKNKSQFDAHPHPCPMASQARHKSVSREETFASRNVVPRGEGESSTVADKIEAFRVGAHGRAYGMKEYRVKTAVMLHPSPASPAANRGDWGQTASLQLVRLGVWR